MKDILGREIKIGDLISYGDPDYAEVHIGVVVGFTNKNVKYCSCIVDRYESPTVCTYDSSHTGGRNYRDPSKIAIINTTNIKLIDEAKYEDE